MKKFLLSFSLLAFAASTVACSEDITRKPAFATQVTAIKAELLKSNQCEVMATNVGKYAKDNQSALEAAGKEYQQNFKNKDWQTYLWSAAVLADLVVIYTKVSSCEGDKTQINEAMGKINAVEGWSEILQKGQAKNEG